MTPPGRRRVNLAAGVAAGITPVSRHVLRYGTGSAGSFEWAVETGHIKITPPPRRRRPARPQRRR